MMGLIYLWVCIESSGALRPIVRCRFEPPFPSGGKPCAIASAVAITPAQAQTASELRISAPLRSLAATSSPSR
jgi:hypothetical protein